MLRKFFIWLSGLSWAQRVITKSKLASMMVLRFVAGETIDHAVSVVKELNENGLLATMDFLGEDTHTKEDAEIAVHQIERTIEAINTAGLRCNISIKLSQLGLTIDEELCKINLAKLLKKARETDNFIRIDMEDSSLTDITLKILFWAVAQGYSNVGIVLQAYLYRTAEDIEKMPFSEMTFRICKGAYNEPVSVAYPKKSDVDDNFDRLVRLLFERSEKAGFPLISTDGRVPSIPGIATHDDLRVKNAIKLIQQMQIPKEAVEFQMLYGIRRELQNDLVEQGYQVRIYVPYGTHWYRYFMRRLAERPANVWFILSNFFKK